MASTNEPWRAAPQLDRVPGRPDVTCLCVLAFATGARDRPPPRSWRRRARHVGAARRSDRLGNGVLRQAGPGATYCRTSCPRRNSRRRGSCMRWPRAAPVVEIPAGTGCAVRTRRKRGKPCSTRLATGSPCLTLVAGCRAALARQSLEPPVGVSASSHRGAPICSSQSSPEESARPPSTTVREATCSRARRRRFSD